MIHAVSDPSLLTSLRPSGSIATEKRTLSPMVLNHCTDYHYHAHEACTDCGALLDDGRAGRHADPYGTDTPFRKARPIHCRETGPRMLRRFPWLTMMHLWKHPVDQATGRGGRHRAIIALLWLLMAVPCQVASAQPGSGTATGQLVATDSTDKTGTNPANLLDTVEMSNAFFSHDDGLFTDEVKWSYGQAFANRRLRARVDLPLVFANVTGRMEAGFGDVGLGGEWLVVVRTSTAFVGGLDLGVDSSTNEALAEGHHTVEPSIAAVFVARRDTVFSLHYRHRLSLGSNEDQPDINSGTLGASFVRRFDDGTWLRAIPAAVFDHEQNDVHTRLDGEWGRMLVQGVSTWVRVGGAFGARAARPFDWSILTGFRFVR